MNNDSYFVSDCESRIKNCQNDYYYPFTIIIVRRVPYRVWEYCNLCTKVNQSEIKVKTTVGNFRRI